jgi:hypothetical protein
VAAGTLAIFYLWISTIVYNVHFRQLTFPVIAIKTSSDTAAVCGLLIYTTDQTRFIWQILGDHESAQGSISAVPRQTQDRVQVLASRSPVEVAQQVFEGKKGVPECGSPGAIKPE